MPRISLNTILVAVAIIVIIIVAIVALSRRNPTIAPGHSHTGPTLAPGSNPGTGLIEGDHGGKPLTGIDIKIENHLFGLSSFTVAKGTTVTWKNYDDDRHTVTSDNGAFDSGFINKNQTFSHTFDQAGTYSYHCDPHPEMKGTIIVQ